VEPEEEELGLSGRQRRLTTAKKIEEKTNMQVEVSSAWGRPIKTVGCRGGMPG